MKRRILGRTGFEVSIVGFGGIPIQRVDEDQAFKLLEEAYNQGVNFIDTARAYEESEALIGKALERIGRDKFILATKSMARTYEGVKKEFEKSMLDLRTDKIELFQFHNVRTEEELDLILSDEGALKAIKEYQEQGNIVEIGITGHSAEVLDKAIDTDEFSTIQYPYNPVERQGEGIFKKAKAKNLGVIIMKPLAGGAIAKGELCLRFIFENEDVTVAIPGMANVDEVKENVNAGINYRPLTESERAELKKEVDTLDGKFCRRCGYCLPCTVGIDIPTQFLMEGYYLRYDLQDWALSRYEKIEKTAGDCIQCGDCEPRCPYDLPIMEMLKRVEKNLG